ncbi:hypothetical protein [Lewinella sp. W8]|uniref:hypothetical protein n=1 Tax=Lewinella sp. W8 TaxID=2528208 RepID=UPI0010675695|nr:hypothetical protein [Lewinella sp. W8]MTB53294.1 hypothetical protein [Lewinella sp. W8]
MQWLKEALSPQLEERAFAWLPDWKQFRRSHERGFSCIILSVSDYPDLSLAEVHLGVRITDCEQLVFPYLNGAPGFRNESMSMVTPLGKLANIHPLRLSITDQKSAHAAAKEFYTQLQLRGFDHLEVFQSVRALHRLYNTHPEEPLPLVNNQIHRCFRGAALAYLRQSPDFAELCNQYRRVLRELFAPEDTRLRFERMVENLNSASLN